MVCPRQDYNRTSLLVVFFLDIERLLCSYDSWLVFALMVLLRVSGDLLVTSCSGDNGRSIP